MTLHKVADNIFIISNFWPADKCESMITKSEAIGYKTATIETERGAKVVASVRNNKRVMLNDTNLSEEIWQELKPLAPAKIGNSVACGLNELFRLHKYQPGQVFKRHIDQSYIRNQREASYYTFMIYLNNNYTGGQTTFAKSVITPMQGTALIFLHSLPHEGTEVISGVKYVLRTDIMYRLEEKEQE